jgi:hypothetical protein
MNEFMDTAIKQCGNDVLVDLGMASVKFAQPIAEYLRKISASEVNLSLTAINAFGDNETQPTVIVVKAMDQEQVKKILKVFLSTELGKELLSSI